MPDKSAQTILATAVLIVTGPPGAGKTTVARALAEQSGRRAVHLHADDFWHFIKTGWVAPYLPGAHEQNRVVIDVLAGAAFGYAAGGYFVVVDGIVGPWFLESFMGCGQRSQKPLHYVVLRPTFAETLRRAQSRGGQALTDREPIESLYSQFCNLGPLERHVIDTSGHDIDRSVKLVVSAFAAGSLQLGS